MQPYGAEDVRNGRQPLGRRYERIVGVTPSGGKSAADRWYEILVTGHDEIGALSKMAAILAQHGVNLAPSGGYCTIAQGTFVWTTFTNFSGSPSSLEDVTRDLKGLNFVEDVDAARMDEAAFDKFLFPVMITEKSRGVILTAAPLVKLEQRLIEQLGTAGAAIMFEEGKQYAIESLKELREVLPESSAINFLDGVVSWLRTTGWGIFRLDTSKLQSEGRIGVQILEPPNAAVSGVSQSHFTNGVAAAMLESVYGKKVRLISSFYNESERLDRLVFEATS